MKKLFVALSVVLLLGGCASPSAEPTPEASQDAPPSAAPTPTDDPTEPEATVEVATPESVAKTLGVADYAQSASIAPFATQWGEGTYEGSRVQIYAFANENDYVSFLEQVKQFGIVESQLVRVGLIVVSVDDQTKTAAVKAALGV